MPDPSLLALVDQLLAAHKDVADVLSSIAPDSRNWRQVDEWTSVSIDEMLSRALAEHGRSGRICPHAWASVLGGVPRPQVLDADREILACLEDCYTPRALSPEYCRPTDPVPCFDCGCPVGSAPVGNLLIAYGPVLVLGSLCDLCDQKWPQLHSRDGSDGRDGPAPA